MSESSRNAAVPVSHGILMVLATAAAVVAAFFGSGAVVGTDMQDAVGGWLGPDATPIAPASTAFSIWSVIYIGLIGYAIWQLSPTARSSERQRRLRLWAILSAALNAAWLWVVQAGWLAVSVLVMLVLLAVLIRILLLMMAHPPQNRVELLLTDGTFGLYLGWIIAAAAANIASLIGATGQEGFGDAWEFGALAALAVLAIIGVGLGLWTRGRIAPALSLAWGLAWISDARSEGNFESSLLSTTAIVATTAVLISPLISHWLQRRSSGSA